MSDSNLTKTFCIIEELNEPKFVFDHKQHALYVDHMGGDISVVKAAKVSFANDDTIQEFITDIMAKGLGCKWVILDHLSILVSGQEETDERKSIDILMTKLRSLVEGTNIGLLLVSHLRRPSGDRGHEDGREVSLSHLRGSASIAHLSDSVIALERNQQAEDATERNTTTVRVLKNRFSGLTGKACSLNYSKDTGRMLEHNGDF